MTPQPPHDPSYPTASLIPGLEPDLPESETRTSAVEEPAGPPDAPPPAPSAAPVSAGPQTDQLDDPLTDPLPDALPDPAATQQVALPVDRRANHVGETPAVPAAGPVAGPPAAPTVQPGIPFPRQQPAAPAPPSGLIPGLPAQPPPPPASPQPQSQPRGQTQVQPHVESQAEATPTEVRRFMSASDFLDRRVDSTEDGPAEWGWQGRVRRLSGGLVRPRRGPAEVAYERDRAAIQKDFDGPRTIAFINPKGGAAKTTGVLAAGYTFGRVRGGGVVAWDNNETRGTLGIRGIRGSHHNTTRELLRDLDRFGDVHQSRIGDLGAFVRSQGDAHFDVLASDERPDVTGTIRAQDFVEVHKLLERFYRVILVDTGNNLRAENWLAAAEAADLLVVTSTIREDTGYSGLWMLDALQDAGYPNLKHKSVTVLSDPSEQVDTNLARDLVDVYSQRTRAVYRVPYDPVLVSGSVVPYNQLSKATRMSWLKACAGMASAL